MEYREWSSPIWCPGHLLLGSVNDGPMPAINEPTMHELLWEWFSDRGYHVSAEVSIENGRIDLIAHDTETDEYLGIEIKDQDREAEQSTIPSAFEGVGEETLQTREDFDWDNYWQQLHRYQTSGYLDRLYFASQRPKSIFEVLDEAPVSQVALDRADTVKETYRDSPADIADIGAIQLPGPHGEGSIEIVREAGALHRERTPSMSQSNEQWVQHHMWKHLDGIREGVLPNRSNMAFRRIDVVVFTGPQDPTEVYKRQPECDIIGVEAKGQGVVQGDTAAIEHQLTDYLDSGALTRLYLAVPAGDKAEALSLLQDTKAGTQSRLDKIGLYTVDEAGTVKKVKEADQVTLRYDGIHTKEGYVTDIIWGYGGDWDQEKQYYSVFEMRS